MRQGITLRERQAGDAVRSGAVALHRQETDRNCKQPFARSS